MFDKSKETQETINGAAKSVDEAAQEITKVAQTVESIKDHLRRNKKFYLVGAGGTAVGATVMAVVTGHHTQIVDGLKLIHIQVNSPNTNTVVTQIERRGHPGFMYRNNVTGEVAGSMKRMAAIDGVSRTFIRDHSVGSNPMYVNLGEMK